jgi:DNA-binding response OmpR family regulator
MSTLRVVVADDNPSMTTALRLVLQLWGWEVIVAHDGMEALSSVREARPAVALIDIGLPRLDGLEVARLLRAGRAAPRLLVALSGYGEDRDRVRSHEAGFDRHLVKPIEPDVLRAVMASALPPRMPERGVETARLPVL